MSYPSFRAYLKTLQNLVKRKKPELAEESAILSHLCLRYGRQIGLPERDIKTLLLAAQFKHLGALTISHRAFTESFDNHEQLMACVSDWFEESAELAALAGLPRVASILSQYYHRAIPDSPLAKIFQVLNAWVACHHKRCWRKGMSDREALIVLQQRAMLAWSDPQTVNQFIQLHTGTRAMGDPTLWPQQPITLDQDRPVTMVYSAGSFRN
jgi:HD-GYP domain-containing protein (c-di-GMP phosphodiesterase class II)